MSHEAIEIVEEGDAAVESNTAGSGARSTGEDQLGSMTKGEPSTRSTLPPGIPDEGGPGDANAGSQNSAVTSCLYSIRRALEETERRLVKDTPSPIIPSCPPSFSKVNYWTTVPEIVSIGPHYHNYYHLRPFRQHKLFFLRRFLRHSLAKEESLIEFLADNERAVRNCYSDPIFMPSVDFLAMMLLDCCFVLELIRIFSTEDEMDEGGPIFTQPWIIPVLIRDLLKVGNQVPFFIVKKLYRVGYPNNEEKENALNKSALEVFYQVYPRPAGPVGNFTETPRHLLHLFYSTFVPKNQYPSKDPSKPQPSDQSTPCVTELWASGIKFKSVKTDNFLHISLQKRALEIPSITIDDFTATLLTNCLALEQCQDMSSKHITDYISFMHCLINQPKDVSLLCSNGIITRFSHNDQYVAKFFNELGNIIDYNVRDCYLSKQLEELESYYNGNWAYIRRTYFSSPWSVIAVFSAFLGIALTMIQTLYAILGHHSR